MDPNIHDVLDELKPLDDLGPVERQTALELAHTLAAIGSLVRERPSPDLTQQVMERIASQPHRPEKTTADRLLSLLHWLCRPRSVSIVLRPASALLALALCFAAAYTARSPEARDFAAPAPDRVVPPVYVQFRLEHANATRVSVVGSFTGWEPAYDMEQTSPGVWSIMLPLRPGVYDYAFLIDGDQWIPDPHALQVEDGFGGVNSRIALPRPPSFRS